MTIVHCSRVQSLLSLANGSLFPRVASLTRGLMATQHFSDVVCVDVILLSLLNTPSSTVAVLRFEFTECSSDPRSRSGAIFPITFLPRSRWFTISPLSSHFISSNFSLAVFFADDSAHWKHNNFSPTSTWYVFWRDRLRNDKLLTAPVRGKRVAAGWCVPITAVIIQSNTWKYFLIKSKWWLFFLVDLLAASSTSGLPD